MPSIDNAKAYIVGLCNLVRVLDLRVNLLEMSW